MLRFCGICFNPNLNFNPKIESKFKVFQVFWSSHALTLIVLIDVAVRNHFYLYFLRQKRKSTYSKVLQALKTFHSDL